MTGPELTRLRIASRLSVSAMARLLEISRVTLYRWEAVGPPRRFEAHIIATLAEHVRTCPRPPQPIRMPLP